jgi:hypothetical protein
MTNFWMAKFETYFHIFNIVFFFFFFFFSNFNFFIDVYLFGIITWALINMDFIFFDIWDLLTFN